MEDVKDKPKIDQILRPVMSLTYQLGFYELVISFHLGFSGLFNDNGWGWDHFISLHHGKRSVFIPIPKKGNAKECSNYHTIALISHPSKVMLKILQVRLQQ